jgi:hypothetical protein
MGSESDPKADTNVINTIFRSGFVLDPSSRKQQVAIVLLTSMKLVKVRRYDVVKCVNEDDDDYDTLDFSQHACNGEIAVSQRAVSLGYTFCPLCNREVKIEGKCRFPRSLVQVDLDHVLSYLLRLLKSKCNTVSRLRSDVLTHAIGTYRCALNDRRTVIVSVVLETAPDFVFSWPRLFKTPVCFIPLNDNEIASAYRRRYVFVPISDLLTSPKPEQVLNECLLTCADYYAKLERPQDDPDSINKMFQNFVNRVSDREFEAFVTEFLQAIATRPKKVLSYLRLLQSDKSSHFGCFNRQIGGSGLQDVFSEPKIEYLYILFKGRKDTEVKHYKRTSIGLRELGELMRFCQRSNTDGILVTSSANVRASVWNEILQSRNSHGYWKYIVIDRPLLLELLTEFGLLGLLGT